MEIVKACTSLLVLAEHGRLAALSAASLLLLLVVEVLDAVLRQVQVASNLGPLLATAEASFSHDVLAHLRRDTWDSHAALQPLLVVVPSLSALFGGAPAVLLGDLGPGQAGRGPRAVLLVSLGQLLVPANDANKFGSFFLLPGAALLLAIVYRRHGGWV